MESKTSLFHIQIPLPPESHRARWRLNRSPIHLSAQLNNEQMVEFWVSHHDGPEYLGKTRLVDFAAAPIHVLLNATIQFWLNRPLSIIPSHPFLQHLHETFLESHRLDIEALIGFRALLEKMALNLLHSFCLNLNSARLCS